MTAGAYYQTGFTRARAAGMTDAQAASAMADACLDGKPAGKATGSERLAGFWSSPFIRELPAHAWAQESLRLVLVRYLGQDAVACPGIVSQLAMHAPDALRWAARHSGLVSWQTSPRFREIEALADSHPDEFAGFVQMLHVFRQARAERVAEVARFRAPLEVLTPLELLAYASLYAFEHIVPAHLEEPALDADRDASLQVRWDAIDALLAWKLANCDPRDFQLDDAVIGRALRAHLMPFLLPSSQEPPRHDLYTAFSALVDAQTELDEFEARSVDAFSFDDSIRFVLRGSVLEIEVVDPDERIRWRREERRRQRLHGYWLYRGMDALVESAELLARINLENFDAHALAMAKAKAAWLCLQEVYGIEARLDAGGAIQVDVFNALLSIELMTTFYSNDFMRPFGDALKQCGHPWRALGVLAMSGFAQGENRLPLTWSDMATKVARIAPWAATRERPQGHPRAAQAILEFWTSDWQLLAAALREGEVGLRPRLQERPILKLGRHLVQLPWMQALQDNRIAGINNLRRLGARRAQAREETRRIEQRLGAAFERRGFQVLVAHELAGAPGVATPAEEIDLLCARDGCLLLLEVKSTYMRRSTRETWLYRTTTLRKAGFQLRRKVTAVRQKLVSDPAFARKLGLDAGVTPSLTAWIVDTSIECDHQRFAGFLKVPLEEVLVGLRDDRHLLCGLPGVLRGEEPPLLESLYPAGFSAARFVEVIESEAVWGEMG